MLNNGFTNWDDEFYVIKNELLPLVLLLLDYWKNASVNRKVIIEKNPLLLFSILFAIITLKIQSTTAVVKLDSYPLCIASYFGKHFYLMNTRRQ
jgi:hypothetical protein